MNRSQIVAACVFALAACKQHETATSSSTEHVAATPSPAAAPPAPAAPTGAFEGEIVLRVTDESATKMPQSMTFDVKGDKVRYSSPGSGVRAVADTAAHRVYAIDDARKTYAALDDRKGTPTTPNRHPAVTKTPWSETVAGHACDLWLIDDGAERVEACAAKGIPFFDLASTPTAKKEEPDWAATLTQEKAFPLRLIARNEAGKEEYRAEATKIDRRTVDDANFAVPAGFKTGDLSDDLRTASLP